MLRVLAVSLVFAVLSACGGQKHSNFPAAPGMNERRFANLKQTAARDLSCPEEQLSHEFVTDPQVKNGLHRLSGCNQRTDYELKCWMGNCLWIQTPLRQAAFELNCPQEGLRSMRLSASQLAVQGCDKRASYVLTCAPGTNCTWLMSTVGEGENTPDAPDVNTNSTAL
jgi:hypothetical protein